MKFLVLGGTKFLGRAIVEAALARGHEVTLFNRGKTNPELFPQAETVHGDRAVDPIPVGHWDAAIDTSGHVPAIVRRSAEALYDSIEQYLFVSSMSAYADFSTRPSEETRRAQLAEGQPVDELLPDYSNYGALKALCEDVVADVYGEGSLIVRPGLIVGPHDPTGRFTYWPHRIAHGGEFIAPAPPENTVQFVDARDLGAWLLELADRRVSGTFNATHPGVPWREFVETAIRVTGSAAEPVWIPGAWLAEQDVGQWMELPMWIHDPEWLGLMDADVDRALEAGLSFRALEETIVGALEHAETTDDAGMKPERERELIEAWRRG
ncbi:MAG TPA: NAD-dependent epimerase/dehydratase family protein [Gaiellaceae bacterium]|nr:NAD-dependent epimerase/dehydratase family protein [Gaiellaceae bacterium]